MDALRARIKEAPTIQHGSARVMLVWWSIGLYESTEFSRLAHEVLDAFVELSIELPDVQFLIKPKPINFRAARDFGQISPSGADYIAESPKSSARQLQLEQELDRRRPGWSVMSNLSIDPWVDMHDAIFDSTVVCGIQSLSLVEAAVAGRHVVVPFFDYFANSSEGAGYQFRHHLAILDVTKDKLQFKDMIKMRLEDPYVSESQIAARHRHFCLHVSDLSESSVEKISGVLHALAKEGRRKRRLVESGDNRS